MPHQKNEQSLLKKLILFSIIVCSILFSCKKIDTSAPNQKDSNFAENFFTTKTTPSKEVADLIEKLKQENNRNGFVSKLPSNCGLPLWDKLVFPKKAETQSFGEDGSINTDNVFIPLTVNGYCISTIITGEKINDTSYQLKWYTATDLYNLCYAKDKNIKKAESLLSLFLYIESSIFNRTDFYRIPKDLFPTIAGISLTDSTKQIKIKHKEISVSTNEQTQSLIYTYCFYIPSGECNCNGPCDWDDPCPTMYCSEIFCINIEESPCPTCGGGGGSGGGTGGGGTGGGEGGGGGGGNPCPLNGWSWYSFVPEEGGEDPCGPPPPPPPVPQTPCEIAHAMAKKLDSLYTKCNVDSVLASIPNLATEPKEKGWAMVKKKFTNPYNPTIITFGNYFNGAMQTGTDSSLEIIQTLGYLQYVACFIHTHPPSGYAAQSAKDIYQLLEDKMAGVYLDGDMVAAYNGDKYAITITDSVKAAVFYQTKNIFLSGRKWNENSPIGKVFKIAKKDFENKYKGNSNKENLAYEMAMSAVLTQFNSGVTLNKKDPATGKFKPLIVKTVIPDPSKPKKKEYIQDCL
jgi:hypothetical protein